MSCAPGQGGFLVLASRAAWDRGVTFDLATSDAGLALRSSVEYAAAAVVGPRLLPGGDGPLALAVGSCRQVYVLRPDPPALSQIGPELQRAERIACVTEQLVHPDSVAAAPGTLYVGDRRGERRIVALAELDRQVRWWVGAGENAAGQPLGLDAPLLPLDLAIGPGARLHVLVLLEPVAGEPDRLPAGGRLGVARFDRSGRLTGLLAPDGLSASDELDLGAASPRWTLAVARDGSLAVLDPVGRRLFLISSAGELTATVALERPPVEPGGAPLPFEPAGLAVDRAGGLYVGDGRPGPLDEDDRFVHRFTPSGEPGGEVAGYRGAVRALAIDAGDRIYVHDPENRRVVLLEPRSAFRGSVPGPPSGVYFSPSLDSTEPGTRWHGAIVEAEVPDRTRVNLSYAAFDDPGEYQAALDDADATPAERRDRLENLLPWSPRLTDPHQVPLGDARGRYLALRLELVGTGEATPRVRSVRARFPFTSYLRYLPAVYQEDSRGKDFLERFLGLFESFFDGFEEELAGLLRTFDAEAVRGEYLAWLGSWLAVAADEGLPEERLRTLVARAPELYRQRGTRPGLEALIEIYTGEPPMIVEHFQLACAQDPEVRALLERLYGSDPYGFCVLLLPGQVGSEEERRAVQRLVEAEKPAHTSAGVRALEPLVILDWHTYLEINSTLGEPTSRLDGGAALARDAVLRDTDEASRIELSSRIDRDASLT